MRKEKLQILAVTNCSSISKPHYSRSDWLLRLNFEADVKSGLSELRWSSNQGRAQIFESSVASTRPAGHHAPDRKPLSLHGRLRPTMTR